MDPIVGIIMGSDSDLPVMSKAAKVLDELGVPYECTIISAHRMPDKIYEYAKTARTRGLKVLIAGAGGAAHLPGIAAAMTTLPVIGVPMQTKSVGGVDSLYSIVQMPSGIPVATMAIGGAQNAGIMAAKMLAITDEALTKKLEDYTEAMKAGVEKKAEKLERIGYEAYLEQM